MLLGPHDRNGQFYGSLFAFGGSGHSAIFLEGNPAVSIHAMDIYKDLTVSGAMPDTGYPLKFKMHMT